MVLIEKVFYKLGCTLADVVYFSATPLGSVLAISYVTKYVCITVKKFSKLATEVI